METTLLPKIEVEIVVCKLPVRTVIETAKTLLYTGHIGDGKIFVYDVENVVKARTAKKATTRCRTWDKAIDRRRGMRLRGRRINGAQTANSARRTASRNICV